MTMLLFARSPTLPYWAAVGLMAFGLAMLVFAARRGKDFAAKPLS
jgi:hypothetical protein